MMEVGFEPTKLYANALKAFPFNHSGTPSDMTIISDEYSC